CVRPWSGWRSERLSRCPRWDAPASRQGGSRVVVGAGREPDCQSGRPSGCESVRAPAVLEGGPESVVAAAPGADPLTTREHTPDRLDDASDRGPSSRTLRINEVFHSIQGESTHAGRPCYFIRLSGCHLRCT